MRPIDADDFEAYLIEHLDAWKHPESLDWAISKIKNCPTLTLDDLRPKGRWEDGNCSCCGASIPTDSQWDFIDEEDCNYCYNCGADMRGGGEDG